MFPSHKKIPDMVFDYFKEIYDSLRLAEAYSKAGLIFRGNFIIWPVNGNRKFIYVIDVIKKVIYFSDSWQVNLNTARVVTEERELMLLYNEVSSAYFKLILKNPPDPDPLLRQGTLFIPGTIFSQS